MAHDLIQIWIKNSNYFSLNSGSVQRSKALVNVKMFETANQSVEGGIYCSRAELRATWMRADVEVRCKQLNMTRWFSNICQLFTIKKSQTTDINFQGCKELLVFSNFLMPRDSSQYKIRVNV